MPLNYDVHQCMEVEVDSTGSFSHLKRVAKKDRHNSLLPMSAMVYLANTFIAHAVVINGRF